LQENDHDAMNARRTIVVAGMIAADRQGGAAWAVLQYLVGLERLGHDVIFVEPIDRVRVEPTGSTLTASMNYRYLVDALASARFAGEYALVESGGTVCAGMDRERLRTRCAEADLLINISGMLADEELIGGIAVRAYLDLDPAFVQLWHAQGIDMRFDAHTHFVTVGLEIGSDRCRVPTDRRTWITTLQPVALERWGFADTPDNGCYTTIANWRGYGSVELDGMKLGQKAHSFRELIDLPRRSRERFRIALAIHHAETADLALLRDNGWELVDPASVAGTPDAYRAFVRSSRGEIGVAKSGYVLSRCGWFSDRSICYLASGRPVVAQETGFGAHIPTGEGLFAFTDAGEAAAAIDSIASDYERHRRSARELASTYFDSDIVLARLLERLGMR
jgi:hypothetical protein